MLFLYLRCNFMSYPVINFASVVTESGMAEEVKINGKRLHSSKGG